MIDEAEKQDASEDVTKDNKFRIIQGRSPAYPFVDLEKAVERAGQIRDAGAVRQSMPPETFYNIWKIGAQSSGARQTMAALNHFGLVDYIGRGKIRKVKLSDLGLKIVLDKTLQSPERKAALHDAALNPTIHRELYDKYGSILPHKAVLVTYLTRDCGYNESAAEALIDQYKATLAYSGLDKPENMRESEADPAGAGDGSFDVGDHVQWESQGQLRWREPWKVVEVAEDDDGQRYLKVEGAGPDAGESGWIPMSEAIAPEAPAASEKARRDFLPPPRGTIKEPPDHTPLPKGVRREVFDLDDGEVVLTYPEDLSKESFIDLKSYIEIFLQKARRRAGVVGHDTDNDG